MNLLPIRLLLAAGLVLLCTTSFTPSSASATSHPSPAADAARKAVYYWYTYPADEFNDYATLSYEELEWWFYYDGVLINTNPNGGTPIARGYLNNNYPHTITPSVWIYAHFTY
jgi:hypothetical protein